MTEKLGCLGQKLTSGFVWLATGGVLPSLPIFDLGHVRALVLSHSASRAAGVEEGEGGGRAKGVVRAPRATGGFFGVGKPWRGG